MNVTKTITAVGFFRLGKFTQALKIFKDFRMGFTKEERRVLQIAYESLTGNAAFYTSLGVNTEDMIEEAKQIIIKEYNLEN